MDSFLKFLLNKDAPSLLAFVNALLEYALYRKNRDVFDTNVVSEMFYNNLPKLDVNKLHPNFKISIWLAEPFNTFINSQQYSTNPSMTKKNVRVNWICALTQMENDIPGFIFLLHQCLQIETQSTKILHELSADQGSYFEYSDYDGSAVKTKDYYLENK